METIEIILTILTGIVALGVILQGLALWTLAHKIRELAGRLEAVSAKLTKDIEVLAVHADEFLTMAKAIGDKVQALQVHVTAISQVVHDRVVDADAFLTEATDTARLQVARFQDVVDTASHRIEETIVSLQAAILAPVSEIQAVIRGVRAGLDVLFGWRRSASRRSHEDEEMFI